MKFSRTSLALTLMALVGLAGCHGPIMDMPPPGRVSLTLDVAEDTLRFLSGDSVKIEGSALLKDDNGNALSGLTIRIANTQSSLGQIEYTNPTLGDTADIEGRVAFAYCGFGHSGSDTLTARGGAPLACTVLWLSEVSVDHPHYQLALSQDSVLWSRDSVQVIVTLTDSTQAGWQPLAGIMTPLRTDCGRVSSTPPSDSTGTFRTWWHLSGCGIGRHWVYIQSSSAHDSASLKVQYGGG